MNYVRDTVSNTAKITYQSTPVVIVLDIGVPDKHLICNIDMITVGKSGLCLGIILSDGLSNFRRTMLAARIC